MFRSTTGTTILRGFSRIDTLEEYSGASTLLDQTQRVTQSSISGDCPSSGCTNAVEQIQQAVTLQDNRSYNGRIQGLTELTTETVQQFTECGLTGDFSLQ